MRILTVCVSTNVFGAEVITLEMLEGFKRAGHEQLAVTSTWTDGEFNRRLATLGIREIRMPFGAISKRLSLQPMWWTANVVVRLPLLWTRWLRTVRQFRPEIIIFTSLRHPLLVYPCPWHVPSFLIEHANLEPTATRLYLYERLARKLCGFIAVSKFTGEHLQRLRVPKGQIYVIRNGVFSQAERQAILSKRPAAVATKTFRSVGIVGQISPAKGHDVLLEALRLLREGGIPLEVRVYGRGDDSYIRQLSQRIHNCGLFACWHWMGYERDRCKVYSELDACIMPSRGDEAFGMAAAEASAFGLPVIASRRGGLPEVVEDGVTGFLIDADNAAQLAGKLSWAWSNPQAANEMGLKGQQKVFHEFTQEKMVSDFETLFVATLEKISKPPTEGEI